MEKLEIVTLSENHFAHLVRTAQLSTCHRSKCGSIVVTAPTETYPDGIVVGVGYNSMPCNEVGECFKDSLAPGFKSDKTCCIHAEQRAIQQALRNVWDEKTLKGCTVFFIRLDDEGNPKFSGEPYCTICSKFALDSGIGRFALWRENGWNSFDTKYYNELSFQYGK